MGGQGQRCRGSHLTGLALPSLFLLSLSLLQSNPIIPLGLIPPFSSFHQFYSLLSSFFFPHNTTFQSLFKKFKKKFISFLLFPHLYHRGHSHLSYNIVSSSTIQPIHIVSLTECVPSIFIVHLLL
jgi:hypothetical protein